MSTFNAWILGQRAAYTGRPRTDNPHAPDTAAGRNWATGWDLAAQKLRAESVAKGAA